MGFFYMQFHVIIISYLRFAATSPYSKEKSIFQRYFSFSDKVFYPVAYIMNGLQHLTILTSLKFYLALICYSSGPNSSKFGPSYPQVGPNFFHLAKEMATTVSEPERTLFKMSFSTFESQLHHTLQNFSIDLMEQIILGYALTLSKTCPCFYMSAVHVF